MKNKLLLLTLAMLAVLIIRCSFSQKNSIFEPMSDNNYIEHYRPLITITIFMYKHKMSEKSLDMIRETIDKMDQQAIDKKKVDIYQSLLIILEPILKETTIHHISKEETQSALISLEVINDMYKKSPLMKEIYPKLKKALQYLLGDNYVDIEQEKKTR